MFITLKNVNVVKADTLLKEGQKYRDARLWDLGIAVHEAARDADPDEDFYYLMLALEGTSIDKELVSFTGSGAFRICRE